MAIYFYVILLTCGLGVTIVNAATVELYPTNLRYIYKSCNFSDLFNIEYMTDKYVYRAMAICISLMMGRLGSVVGANLVGFLLDYHCEAAFYICGVSLICKYLF